MEFQSFVNYTDGRVIANRKLQTKQGIEVTGSIDITGGKLLGTASFAETASVLLGSITSASYALTASYALNGGGGGGTAFPYTGSAEITGSLTVTGSVRISDTGATQIAAGTTAQQIATSSAVGGMLRYNSTFHGMEYFNAQYNEWYKVGVVPTDIEYVVVAGGGGGGKGNSTQHAGGGGAGGYRTNTGGGGISVSGQSSSLEPDLKIYNNTPYRLTIGAGGAGATVTTERGSTGGTTIFGPISASGGGGGGSISQLVGGAGGAGGGGAGFANGGAGTTAQGFGGGTGNGDTNPAGGGGALSTGSVNFGGLGISCSIQNHDLMARGGATPNASYRPSVAGDSNRGDGGSGASGTSTNGYAGGSGVVRFRVPYNSSVSSAAYTSTLAYYTPIFTSGVAYNLDTAHTGSGYVIYEVTAAGTSDTVTFI